MKACSKCKVEKSLDEFSPNTKGPDGRYSQCRACRAATARRRHAASPELQAASSRRWKLASFYGITPDDYGQMLAEQGGGCEICGAEPGSERNHGAINLAVDHDHDTGQVRGLLCLTCNRLLEKRAAQGEAAEMAYIEKYQKITSKENQ